MDHRLVFQGLVVGFGVAAPVGPIGILVIRRSMTERATLGFATGLGAAVADTIFAAFGALGLFAVASRLGPHEALLRGLGGVIVGVIGARALMQPRRSSDTAPAARTGEGHAHVRAFATTFLLTITNPMTIASFAALAASAGAGRGGGDAVSFVVGVFAGSSAWWLLLSRAASLFRGRISSRGLAWSDRISGCVLLAFAAIAVVSAVMHR